MLKKQQIQPREKFKYKELSANTIAFISSSFFLTIFINVRNWIDSTQDRGFEWHRASRLHEPWSWLVEYSVFMKACIVLQVGALLYIAYIMIHWMWKRKVDPDNSAIPYLTSLGDLLGISLLAIAFHFLYLVGDGDVDQGDQCVCCGAL